MKSDIEIAREVSLRKIKEIATGLGIPREEVQNYGRYIAKIPIHLIDEEKIRQHNLILVTAITPTKAGIGKTTVSIGLALGLNKIGKKAVVALREPSLGPCFGMKGGAAGGGYSQVVPMEDINLVNADTEVTNLDPGAYSQAAAFVGANAVKAACENARKRIVSIAAEKLGTEENDIGLKNRMAYSISMPDKKMPISWVVREAFFRGEPDNIHCPAFFSFFNYIKKLIY